MGDHHHEHGHGGEQAVVHGDDGGGAHQHGGMMGMHAMAFHFGTTETILFGFWHTNSAFGIFVSCIAIIGACFGMEFVRWYRLHRKRILYQKAKANDCAGGREEADSKRVRLAIASMDACLLAVQLTISYLLMLVFMSFNVWLCAAIILGEVGARLLLTVSFPHLDLLSAILNSATGDPCCG